MSDLEQIVECEICEKKPKSQKQFSEWWTYNFEHPQGTLILVSCPKCAKLGGQAVLDCYLRRIRDGRNVRYH